MSFKNKSKNVPFERRHFPRAPINVDIYCEGDSINKCYGKGILCLFSNNISVGGIFLESNIAISLGSIVFLRFKLPNSEKEIRLVGKVIRHQIDKNNILEGLAVEFIRIGFEERKLIENYVNENRSNL